MTTQKKIKNNHKIVKLIDYTPAPYLITDTFLDFHLSPSNTLVHAELHIVPNTHRDTVCDTLDTLEFDGEKLALQAIYIDDIALDASLYEVTEKTLVIKNPPTTQFKLKTICTINPEKNTELNGLYLSNTLYCTQCEAEGFRRITYFFDRPDVLSRFHVRIQTHTQAPFRLSNGNCIAEGIDTKTGLYFTQWENPYPMPCYLFALVAGDFDVLEDSYTTCEDRVVALKIFVEKGKKERAIFAMKALKRAMEWDERVYGFAYDLEVFMLVAISDFNMGAMENKGLNIFNDKYLLADPHHATDDDYQNIERIIAHEYFHNWTGNRITCRDWFQLCLKEGLTVFREQQYCADQFSDVNERIKAIHFLHCKQFIDDAGPLAHPVRPESYMEINNFYNATVYEKGAELFRMLFTYLGENAYYKGISQFFKDHDGHAACIEDILESFAIANPDYRNFLTIDFLRWYNQAGTPEIKVETHYDADEKKYSIQLSQSLPSNTHNKKLIRKELPVPLRYGLLDSQGHDIALSHTHIQPISGCKVTRDILLLEAQHATIHFHNIDEKPILSILRDFSAPVKISHEQSEMELAHIIRHDSDTINRWRAIQQLYWQDIEQLLNNHKTDFYTLSPVLNESIEYVINCLDFAPHVKHALLTPPHYSEISLKCAKDIDPKRIFNALHAVQKSISSDYSEKIIEHYNICTQQLSQELYEATPKNAELRAYKNFLLCLYGQSEPQKCEHISYDQFQMAHNLTDRLGAVRAVNNIDSSMRTTLLDQLIDNVSHKIDDLLLDKYLLMHATSQLHDCIYSVQGLITSQYFDTQNPNRIFALLGGFAFSNPLRFHDDNGKAYRFLSKQIIKIDQFNPQIASRLMSAFSCVSTLKKSLRHKMLPEIEKIITHRDISSNTLEIAQKILSSSSR